MEREDRERERLELFERERNGLKKAGQVLPDLVKPENEPVSRSARPKVSKRRYVRLLNSNYPLQSFHGELCLRKLLELVYQNP